MRQIKFTSIDKLSTTYQNIKNTSQFIGVDSKGFPVFDENITLPKIKYRGTVKLHGTCAGVSQQGGNVVPLSKERVLTVENDNDDFAAWVYSKEKEVWEKLFNEVKSCLPFDTEENTPITLFGEWCGKGIQKKAAITKCERLFLIFAVRVGDDVDKGGKAIGWYPLDAFKNLKDESEMIYNSLMFENHIITFDWNSPKEIQNFVEEKTSTVNDNCPVSSFFNNEGIGEGLVWVPVDEKYLNNTRFWFKTKGENHKQNKNGKDSDVDPLVLKDVKSVIDEYLVENRLERGIAHLKESGVYLLPENTRFFVEFIVNDVKKDAVEHIKNLDADEKTIKKAISNYSGRWYNKFLEELEK
jgi:hypothetical protein